MCVFECYVYMHARNKLKKYIGLREKTVKLLRSLNKVPK